MVEISSARYSLPFLAASQAQKEITHNEALLRIDALLHPVAEAELANPPVILAGTDAGKCWLIANSAVGEWQGKGGQIAYWTGGSWRFLTPVEGMPIRNRAQSVDWVRTATGWTAPTAIANVTGGVVVDVEARATLTALLTRLRMDGTIAT